MTKTENITKDITASYGEKPQSRFLRDASMDIVSPSDEKVNSKFKNLKYSRDDGISEHPEQWTKKKPTSQRTPVFLKREPRYTLRQLPSKV